LTDIDLEQLLLWENYHELKGYSDCEMCDNLFKNDSGKRRFCDKCVKLRMDKCNSRKTTNKDNGLKPHERLKYENTKS